MRRLSSLLSCNFCVLAALCIIPQAGFAQVTGSLAGTLVDDKGKAVSDATLRVTRAGTPPFSATASSAKDGSFTFTSIPAGTYSVCVMASGYLDPCTWSLEPPSAQVVASQTTKGMTVIAQKGAK